MVLALIGLNSGQSRCAVYVVPTGDPAETDQVTLKVDPDSILAPDEGIVLTNVLVLMRKAAETDWKKEALDEDV